MLPKGTLSTFNTRWLDLFHSPAVLMVNQEHYRCRRRTLYPSQEQRDSGTVNVSLLGTGIVPKD
jgi:hypothetical protein